MVVQLTFVTRLPAGMELVAVAMAACLLRSDPAVADPASPIDLYIGSGGAPEGVLAAAALRCAGGWMQGRLLFRDDAERQRAARWGVTDLHRKYGLTDLARGNVIFAASGVTDGPLLDGVHPLPNGGFSTHSLVMCSRTGTTRRIRTVYPPHGKGG